MPESAVIDTGTRKVVYVEAEPGVFEGREVVLGPRTGDRFPVLEGLAPGEKVAATRRLPDRRREPDQPGAVRPTRPKAPRRPTPSREHRRPPPSRPKASTGTDAERRTDHDRVDHRVVDPQPLPRDPRLARARGRGLPRDDDDAGRRDPRPLREPGHRLHRLDGPQPPGDRGPDHLPPLGQPPGARRGQGRAVVERVQLLDDHDHLQGRDRLLLRPPARPGEALDRLDVPAAGRDPLPRPRRHGRRPDLLVHRRRGRQGPQRAAVAPGLVRPLPAQQRARRGRGRLRRRGAAGVSDRPRPEQAPGLRRQPRRGRFGRRPVELVGRRPGDPPGERRVPDPLRRLDREHRRHPRDGRRPARQRHADQRRDARHGPGRPRLPPERAGEGRQGGRRRRGPDAIRREPAGSHPAGQGEDHHASGRAARRACGSSRSTTGRR